MRPPILAYERQKTSSLSPRRVVVIIALVIAAVALIYIGHWSYLAIVDVAEQRKAVADVLTAQAKADSFVAPRGLVVYDDSPDARKRYPGLQYGYAVGGMGSPLPNAAGWRPSEYDQLKSSLANARVSMERNILGAMPLLHKLKSPNGQETLVVGCVYGPDPYRSATEEKFYALRFYHVPFYTAYTLPPKNTGIGTPSMEMSPLTFWLPAETSLRVQTARMDPADASHVIIPMLVNDRAVDIHLWFRDDGNVDLRSSAGAVLQLPSPGGLDRAQLYLDEAKIEPGNPAFHRGIAR